MINEEKIRRHELGEAEVAFVRQFSDIRDVQRYLDGMPYDFEEDGIERFPSFREGLRMGKVHCFTGAMLAAGYLYLTDQNPPLFIALDALDISHNIIVYKKDGKWGSVAASRQDDLRGRNPQFRSIRDLALSYAPGYTNTISSDPPISLRGVSRPLRLDDTGDEWLIGNNANRIVRWLYTTTYQKLFPENDVLYKDVRTKKDRYRYPNALSLLHHDYREVG